MSSFNGAISNIYFVCVIFVSSVEKEESSQRVSTFVSDYKDNTFFTKRIETSLRSAFEHSQRNKLVARTVIIKQ